MTSTRTRAAHAVLLLTVTGSFVALSGCSNAPTPTVVPSSSAVTTVPLPAPDARGPTLTLEGLTDWSGSPPGCATIQLANGQAFQLTGPAYEQHLREVRAHSAPPTEWMRITGFVTPAAAGVCGPRSFRADQVASITH
jgi:hypothetical protein